MAKKTRRPNIPQETLERARRQMSNAPVAPVVPVAEVSSREVKAAAAAAPKRRALTSADLSVEYAYVVSDLRSMGILAGAFLAVLIALSFII